MGAGVFLIIWGALFGGIPLIALITTLLTTDNFPFIAIPFIMIFVVVGAFVFVKGILEVVKSFRVAKMRLLGTQTTATFESMNEVDRQNYTITLSYTNKNGENIVTTTKAKYSYKEASYYKAMKNFNIMYLNGFVLITQPYNINNVLINNTNSYEANKDAQAQLKRRLQEKHYYVCEYCGNVQEEPGKCKSCGARVIKKF